MLLQKLRNPYVMKWGLWAIIGLTIPAFVLFYGFGKGNTQHDPFAGALITLHTDEGEVELDRQYLTWVKDEATGYYLQLAMVSLNLQPQQLAGLRGAVSNSLSNMEVAEFAMGEVALTQRLDRQDVRLTDSQVSMYLTEQGYTAEALSQYLERTGMTEIEFIAQIRQQLKAQMAEQSVARVARTSLLELWNEYLLSNERLTGQMVRFAVPFTSTIEVADNDVKTRYEELIAKSDPLVIDKAKRVYEYVKIPAPKLETLTPTEEEIRGAYEDIAADDPEFQTEGGTRVRHVLVPTSPADTAEKLAEAREKASQARRRIADGEAFAAVANEVSEDLRNLTFDDRESSPTLNGGMIPYLLRENIGEAWGGEWASYIQTAEPGELSPVIETPQGYSVVEVIERVPAGKKPFEQVRTAITERIEGEFREAAETERQGKIEDNLIRMRESVASQTSLGGIARDLDTTVGVTSPTLVSSLFIGNVGNLTNERESMDALRPGRTSPVLQTSNGDVVVLRISEEIPERNFGFDEVADRIRREMQREKEVAKARDKAEMIRARLTSGDTFTSAALTVDPTLAVTRIQDVPRQASSQPPPEFRGIQELDTKLIGVGAGDSLVLTAGSADFVTGIVLFHIESIDSPTIPEFMEAVQNERYELQFLIAKRQGYLEEFRRDAKDSLRAEFSEFFAVADEKDNGRQRRN